MSMKRLFSVPGHSTFGDLALLLLRLGVGTAFMIHGWGKIQTPFSWMGPDAPIPGILQSLAAISEFFGGLALILGLLVPLASFGIACTMAVAVFFHSVQKGDPFVSPTGGSSWELPAAYLCIALVLIGIGPGRFSLDRTIFNAR